MSWSSQKSKPPVYFDRWEQLLEKAKAMGAGKGRAVDPSMQQALDLIARVQDIDYMKSSALAQQKYIEMQAKMERARELEAAGHWCRNQALGLHKELLDDLVWRL